MHYIENIYQLFTSIYLIGNQIRTRWIQLWSI